MLELKKKLQALEMRLEKGKDDAKDGEAL